jgi:hypothetical protein
MMKKVHYNSQGKNSNFGTAYYLIKHYILCRKHLRRYSEHQKTKGVTFMYMLICVLCFLCLLFAIIKCIHIDKTGKTSETKKCMRCLRRVKIFYYKCPYCRSMEFIHDTDKADENAKL